MQNLLKTAMICLMVVFVFSQCGGDESSETDNCETPTVNLIGGSWDLTFTNTGNDCGDTTGVPNTYTETIIQSGNTITVSGESIGRVCGNTVTFKYSYPEDGGTTKMTIVCTATDTTMTGTYNYTWTGGFVCSGAGSFSAIKN